MDERVTVEYVYEYWDCAACGRRGVRGDARYCPSCGKARDKNVRFYRQGDKEETITEKAEQDRLSAGPDWICAFCSTTNNFHDQFCGSCGARSDAKKSQPDRVGEQPVRIKPLPSADWTCLRCGTQNKQADEHCEGCGADYGLPPLERPAHLKQTPLTEKRIDFAVYAIRGLLILLATGVLWCGYRTVSCVSNHYGTHTVVYKVTERKWKSTIVLESKNLETLTAWANELPSDAKVLRREKKIRSYRDIQTGTRTESYEEEETAETTRTQEKTSVERVKTGEREECATTYESIGSGAARKVTRCKNVPIYADKTVTTSTTVPATEKRKVTKERDVPVYDKQPVFDTEVTYRAWRWSEVRRWETAGSVLPVKPPQPVLRPAERAANYRLSAPRTVFEVTFARSDKGDAPASTVQLLEEAEFAKIQPEQKVEFLFIPYKNTLERKAK
ncbi:MAG TPA: hypothetical protein PKG67_04755 [Turneriella sp.]|nr:hypothetical protein [Turneriella sp.]